MTEIPFVVRLQTSSVLKAAFRLHLSPEALQHLHLRVGDVCGIISEDGTRGAAIAWRATDKMGSSPKVQPAKMSETLRDTFGFKQGTQIRVERVEGAVIHPARRISLVEITPNEWDRFEDDSWKVRAYTILAQCEAVAAGMSFDVLAGERWKKRFYIEHIDSNHSADTPSLYRINDDTDVKICDGASSPAASMSAAPPQRSFHIESSRIGGLVQQVERLNSQLRWLCSKARCGDDTLSTNQGVVLYGFEGTGKTLLLEQLAKTSGFRSTVRLTRLDLSGTSSKVETTIHKAFEQARSSQPSLILIDQLDDIARNGDEIARPVVSALGTALDHIHGTEVQVIATARTLQRIDHELLSPERLMLHIELPIPDRHGRKDILTKLMPHGLGFSALEAIADSSHGFTGRDLKALVARAIHLAWARYDRSAGSWQASEDPHLAARPSTASSINGRAGSIATTLVDESIAPDIRLTLGDLQSALHTIRPSALQEVIVEPPNISFDDIGGSEELHARFDRLIDWPIKHADKYDQSSRGRRGILLYGPPGCSKTMTAQAVAKTYGWNFVAIKGAELISMYVGESERALRDIFRKARQAAPAIIFFDEIDSIATARSGSSDNKGLNVLTTLLTEMDGFEALNDVLVLAATNRPEILDPAVLRPGRFDEHIYIGPPNEQARHAILEICRRGNPARSSVDIPQLVSASEKMSGAELRNAWLLADEKAIERAVIQDNQVLITTEDVINGIRASPHGITDRMLSAYHDFAASGTK